MPRIAFYRADKGHLVDKLIAFWSEAKYSHVELVFDDPTVEVPRDYVSDDGDWGEANSRLCFSSSPRNSCPGTKADNGCRFRWIDLLDGKWDVVDLPGDAWLEQYWAEWCCTRVGYKYDWPGIFGFALGPHHDDHKRFCSEVVCEVLQHFGVLPDTLKRWRISPGDLYDILGGKKDAS